MTASAGASPVSGDGEWLLTDGAGGFAMAADGGPASRRYHAWLITALDPPLRRTVLWRGCAEWWEPDPSAPTAPWGGERRDGSCLRFADEGSPPGPVHGPRPDPVRLGPDGRVAAWSTRLRGVHVDRRLELSAGSARMHWTVTSTAPSADDGVTDGSGPGFWCVRPFTPLIPFHGLLHEGETGIRVEPGTDGVVLRRGDVVVELAVGPDADWFRRDAQWWNRFAYEHERARGQDWIGDEWSPGVVRVPLAAGEPVAFHVTVRLRRPWSAAVDGDADRDADRDGQAPAEVTPAIPSAPTSSPATPRAVLARLEAAAESFVVRRGDDRSIIAGYPWFADWGRDALISLPGLLPPGARDDEAVSVLAALAAHRRDGLLPNCFHDETGANDHAADTGPWFLRTLAGYAASSGGVARARAAGLFDAAADIIDAVVAGTRHGIRRDHDGLITAGEPGGPAVTWMDAMRDGISFTPRHGKAVEINALWIEGLRGLARVEPDSTRRARYDALADDAATGFAAFAWPERGCLIDCLAPRDPFDPDSAIDRPVHELRPNQLIAAACPAVPLDREQRAGIVAACRASLLTPYGLRTLEPTDSAYIGRYEGDLRQRDAAYHQGTVWPWLMGPLADAMFLAAPPSDRGTVAAHVWRDLQPLLATLDSGCRGQLAEVHGGDAPHPPDGCPAQAWSVAEVRRVLQRVVAIQG
jgi:predicted glycogen debranching enzyme